MSYSDYLVQPRTRGQGGSPAVGRRQRGGREARPYLTFGAASGQDVLSHVLDPGRSSFLDLGQGRSPAAGRRQRAGRKTWPYRNLTDPRPVFGEKVRDVAELVMVAVYASAALAEMVMALSPPLH
jgi:hypothetical protein